MRLREVVRGADLGSSSNYSDEIQPTLWVLLALKTVVEEVSLSMAIRQGLVGPKQQVNSVNGQFALVAKGNQVNIPELENGVWLQSKVFTREDCGKFPAGFSFLFNVMSE